MTVYGGAGGSPAQRIAAECARRGRAGVISGCVRLIEGGSVDDDLIVALGGSHARRVLDGGPRDDQRYWLRVWATRGLLWTSDDESGRVTGAIRTALADPSWRVREMAAKVVARHLLGDLLPAVLTLRADPVARVRAAALRAVTTLTRAGA